MSSTQSPAMGVVEKKRAEDTKKIVRFSWRVAAEKASDEMVKVFPRWKVPIAAQIIVGSVERVTSIEVLSPQPKWEETMEKTLQLMLLGMATMTGLTIGPTLAASQDLELRVGPGGAGIYDPDRDLDGYYRGGRRVGCDPEDAIDIARSQGLRRAQIVRVSPRRIVVQGVTRRGPERMTFANRRGCPEI